MEKSSLLAGGKHYDLLINWPKRLKLEIPFLMEFLKDFGPQIKTILEVGCGTGQHTAILHRKMGYQVTAIDIDESMIVEARKRVPEAELLVHDFLDRKFLNGRVFDVIISLGNSVGLMAASSDYNTIIERFAELMSRKGGHLIFQVLNTEREREGWSPPRSIIDENGEFIFLRGFTTSDKYIHPEIITLHKPKNDTKWQMVTTGKAHIPSITHKKMNSILKKHNFKNIKVFGDYRKNPFHPSSSVDMIYVCEY